jgi:HEAT repeat protein
LTLNDLLTDIGDEQKPLKYSGLLHLSGLSSDEMDEFKDSWASVPHGRKQDILGKLVELSDENPELDFSGVYMASLDDGSEDVREKAARGLWECEDRTVIRPLISLLSQDMSAKVRAAAAMSLGKFSAMAQNGKLLSRDGDRIRESLMRVIGQQQEELEVRRRAVEALAHFDFPETDEIIREAYYDGDMRLRQSALYAMGQSSKTQWLPIVLADTNDERAVVRYEAANACGQLGDESTVSHLIKLIQDEDAQVQLAALMALGNIGGPLAKRALHQCLKMGDETLEEAALEALKSMEFEEDPLNLRFES